MDLTIKGNPGTGNKYNDVRLGHAGSYNPAAKDVHHYYLAPEPAESRLSTWFRKLAEEFRNDEKLRRKLDDIKRYKTVLTRHAGWTENSRTAVLPPTASPLPGARSSTMSRKPPSTSTTSQPSASTPTSTPRYATVSTATSSPSSGRNIPWTRCVPPYMSRWSSPFWRR